MKHNRNLAILFLIPALAIGAETKGLKTFSGLIEKYTYLSPLESIASPYRDRIRKLLETWPKSVPFKRTALDAGHEPEVDSLCYSIDKNPTYIGVGQRMVIAASFERTASIVDDFTNYVGIFNGLVRVTPLEVDGNRTLTEWEQEIPFPLIPNEHMRITHLISQPKPGFRLYRYGLKKSDHLTQDDGVIVLERISDALTLYTEFDFLDADWGIAKSFGIERLWKESLEDIYQSDLALKLRAENADWTAKRVLEESEAHAKVLLKRADDCPKVPFPISDPNGKI